MSHIHVAGEEGGTAHDQTGPHWLGEIVPESPWQGVGCCGAVNLPCQSTSKQSVMRSPDARSFWSTSHFPGPGGGQLWGAPPRSRDRAAGPSALQRLDRVLSQSTRVLYPDRSCLHEEQEA